MILVSPYGEFGFKKSFLETSMLKSLLSCSFVNPNFEVYLQNGTSIPPSKNSDQLSKLLNQLVSPRKEVFKQQEMAIKILLFIQFVSNFKRGEGVDLVEYILAQAQSMSPASNHNSKQKTQTKSQ